MHKNLPTLFPRFVDPLANGWQLRLERVDAVVAHALDVEDLYAAFALLNPERARLRGRKAGLEGALPVFRRNERALADRDDVRDAERMEHVRVGGVVPVSTSQYE